MKTLSTTLIILLTTFVQAQTVPIIISSVNYDRSTRKAATVNIGNSNANGRFSVFFSGGNETPSTTDLRSLLDSYTAGGKIITIQKVPLGVRTGQAFYITANSTNVTLQYTTGQSLDNAVYSYMGLLGIQFYGAGDRWLVKPAVVNDVVIAGEWREPTFRNRTFDGTGGLEFALTIDPNHDYRTIWYEFKRRNRFNADFHPPGHNGQAFYITNKALLDSHPEWFSDASPALKLSGTQNGRIKIEIPTAVQAYADWISRGTPSLTDSFTTINVDPEDGRGGPDDPLPPNGFRGLNNWNASEKIWSFANDIASRYDSNSTKIHISALSYGDGPTVTLVPRFPLKKNVIPVLTPYAFQTAYLPKQMIRAWHRNTPGEMAIYDYWNITQYSLGLPQFNIYTIPSSLSFWKQNGINGIQQETTDANGPTGHMFWLTGQLEFDTTKNIDTLFKKYLSDCYGPAQVPMKNMLDRWSLNYQKNYDVNYSLRDLNNATQLVVVNSPEWKRINDMKAYVHFMKLMAQRNPTDSLSNDGVYQYMYSVHYRTLIQTVAFTGQRYFGTAAPPNSAHQLTDAEVETNFNADLASLPVQFEPSSMVFDYSKVSYVDSIPIDAWKFGYFAGANFKASFNGTVSVDMGTRIISQTKIYTQDSSIVNSSIAYNDSTSYSFLEVIGGNTWFMKNYTFNVELGKIYSVGTSPGGFGRVRMRTPNIVLIGPQGPNDFDNAQYPLKYFYVPIGTTKIAYFDSEVQGLNGGGYMVTPTGIELVRTPTNAAGVYTVNVPVGQDGKLWSARFGHSSWSLANIPNYVSLQKFSYAELAQ